MRRVLFPLSLAIATMLLISPAHAAVEFPTSAPARGVHQVSPLLTNFYDGANRQQLATSDLGSLNEEDLLLYLLVNNDQHPAAYDDYMLETDPLRKQALRQQLEEKINDYFYTMHLASMDRGPELTETQQAKARAMTAAVVEFVWLDRIIGPQVDLTPGEMRLYYRNHAGEFITPHRVHVRYIFRALDPAMTRSEVNEEEKLMDSLREVLQQNPEKFQEAARQYSQAPSATNGGEVPPFSRGEYFKQFEENAFNLTIPGEVSSIFRGDEGLFLVQLIDHIMPEAIDYDDAQEQLRRSVQKQEMAQMARYAMKQLREKAQIELRSGFWNDLRDNDVFLSVGEEKITKAEFWKLYPSIIDVMGNLSGAEYAHYTKRHIESTLMRQDLEAQGLGDDPRLARAMQLAVQILRAGRVEKNYLDHKNGLTTAQSAPTMEGFEVLASGAPRKRVFKITGEILDSRKYDATTLVSLRETLPRVIQSYIDKAQSGDAPASEEAVDRLGKAPAVVRGAKQIEDERFKFSWQDIGWIDLATTPNLQLLLSGTGEGQFSSVEGEGDMAVVYYVAAERKLSPEEREQLELRARLAHAKSSRQREVAQYRNGVAQSQNVAYSF